MFEKTHNPNYQELNQLIEIIARNRAQDINISEVESTKLDNLLDFISVNGLIPKWMGRAPSESHKDDVVMYLEGSTKETIDFESTPAYIQWGNHTNLKCIHLGFLGLNFTILKNSENVFSHEMKKNLDEDEIREISNMVKRTCWQYPEYKSISEILTEEKTRDLS